MAASTIRVWTYWEGPRNALQILCEHSIERQVGNLWCPITPDNVQRWMTLPKKVLEHASPRVRSDYIRTVLLYEHGGVWLDSDVLLQKDVLQFVGSDPVAWRENQEGRKRLQGLSIGALVFPFPGHRFLSVCLELYAERLKDSFRHSMGLYHSAWRKAGEGIEVRDHKEFYAVPCTEWRRFWKEPNLLDLDVVGLHLWASCVGPGTKRYDSLSSVERMVAEQPQSVMAEYARRHALNK